MFNLGIDVGSSSVKASLLDAQTGRCAGSAFYPKTEQKIHSPQPGFAEQDPQDWYNCAKDAVRDAMHESGAQPEEVKAIGIACQMHGLVCVDKKQNVLRPAIIWCDSRAVPYGQSAFDLVAEKGSGSFFMQSGATLTIDGSNYTGGEGIIDLVQFGSTSGSFAAGDVTIENLASGLSGSIGYDSDSMYLEVIPEPVTVGLFAISGLGLMIFRRSLSM